MHVAFSYLFPRAGSGLSKTIALDDRAAVDRKATGDSLFEDAKFPPPRKKIPENSRSLKYFILHTPVPKSATFIGSIYNNSSFWLTLHATIVILVFESSSTVTGS